MVVIMTPLIVAGTAFAASSTLTVKGPHKMVASGAKYEVTISGTAAEGASTMEELEGGYANGTAIKCDTTYRAEVTKYGSQEFVAYSVTGRFVKHVILFANSSGDKALCAYLTNAAGTATYAHASAHWRNG